MILLSSPSVDTTALFYDFSTVDSMEFNLIDANAINWHNLLLSNRPTNELSISFNINGLHEENLNLDYSKVIDVIKSKFGHCTSIKFMPRDVPAYHEDYLTYKELPEFKFYKEVEAVTDARIDFYHPQPGLFPDHDVQYIDLYLFDFYNWFEVLNPHCFHKIQLPKRVFEFEHRLSCLNNSARWERGLITVLLNNTDTVLSHNGELGEESAPENIFSDKRIIERYRKNVNSAVAKFSNDCYHTKIDAPDPTIESFELIQRAFCNIVTEDPFYSQAHRITEKTIKAMLCYRPFLLMAPTGTLKWLRGQGFKTFSKWWDESYDDIQSHHKRLEAVYRIAEHINSLSIAQCNTMMLDMKKVLKHNANRALEFQYDVTKNYVESR